LPPALSRSDLLTTPTAQSRRESGRPAMHRGARPTMRGRQGQDVKMLVTGARRAAGV